VRDKFNKFGVKNFVLEIDNLHPGYQDVSTIILYASFQSLVDYVEEEMKLIEWSWNKEHSDCKKEMDLLYHWWKKIRPNRKEPYIDKSIWKGIKLPKHTFTKKDKDTWILDPPKYKNKEHQKAVKNAWEQCRRREEEYAKEDEKMLQRLLKIKRMLWS